MRGNPLTRLEEVILFLLSRAGEKGLKDLSKFQIMKLIYLVDVESYRYTGKSFFGDVHFVRQKNGPISKDIYDALNRLHPTYIHFEQNQKEDYPYPRHCISLKKPARIHLADDEKIFLNSVFESFLSRSQKELKKLVYETEPMKDILNQEKRAHKTLIGSRILFESIPLDKDVVEMISA